jgi:hypothetical protein
VAEQQSLPASISVAKLPTMCMTIALVFGGKLEQQVPCGWDPDHYTLLKRRTNNVIGHQPLVHDLSANATCGINRKS